MKANPDKVDAVRQLIADRLQWDEVRAHDPGLFSGHVEFLIGKQRIRIEHERFDDHDTAEEILPDDALHKALWGDSFLLMAADEIIIEDPEK